MRVASERFGIGIDAGGTSTRWAVVDTSGTVVGHGEVSGLSALMLMTTEGRQALIDQLGKIPTQVRALNQSAALAVYAGVTGLDSGTSEFTSMLADVFSISTNQVVAVGDIELAYRAAFQPGEGYLVYSGTGSIAAFIDNANVLHRVGGRGVLLDDGGGGYWIGCEALRAIWRAEDVCPGAWQQSAMARAVFARLGGNTWAKSREYFYSRTRGEIGMLALAVAETAATDPHAIQILSDAGEELARLGRAMLKRFGLRPIVVAGRAALLHPAIMQSMREHIPLDAVVTVPDQRTLPQQIAAKMALALHAGEVYSR
jgi:glucosamine kinase